MRKSILFAGLTLAAVVCVTAGIAGRQAAPQAGPPAQPAAQPTAAAQPQITLSPGLRAVPDYRNTVVDPPAMKIPDGFTSIFNGRDLTGWHISQTARHGIHPDFHVAHGMILGTQSPLGGGGLLLTNKTYRSFELYMEVKPDWGCDSGVFFRTTENGAAYQITMDYLPGGSMGRMISEGGIQLGGERGAGAAPGANAGGRAAAPAVPQPAAAGQPAASAGRGTPSNDAGMNAWKREEWNTIRIRVQGDAPHSTVWINDQQISDATDTQNSAVGGMLDGPVAIQIHGGGVRWQPGGFWRWRNLAIRELPSN